MKPLYCAVALVLFSGVTVAKRNDGQKKTSVTGYVHILWTYDHRPEIVPDDEFRVRRARIKFRSDVSDNIRVTVEMGCGQAVFVAQDVCFEYRVNRALRFVGGQHKMSFSQEELRPSSKLLVVDRGEVNDVFGDRKYLGRDIGISVRGEVLKSKFPIRYALGVFNGSGCKVPGDYDNSKQFVERIAVSPVKNLFIGMNSTQRDDSLTGEVIMAHGADFSYARGGATVEGEILSGNTEPGKTMVGGYVVGLYRIDSFEPALKIERLYSDSRKPSDYFSVFTYGLNWYFHRKARLQANLITNVSQEQGTHHVAAIQAQVGF